MLIAIATVVFSMEIGGKKKEAFRHLLKFLNCLKHCLNAIVINNAVSNKPDSLQKVSPMNKEDKVSAL